MTTSSPTSIVVYVIRHVIRNLFVHVNKHAMSFSWIIMQAACYRAPMYIHFVLLQKYAQWRFYYYVYLFDKQATNISLQYIDAFSHAGEEGSILGKGNFFLKNKEYYWSGSTLVFYHFFLFITTWKMIMPIKEQGLIK